MDASESRFHTIWMSGFAVATVVAFAAIYGPELALLEPGSAVRPPFDIWSLLVWFFAMTWWLPCVVMGVRQLFVRPRRDGLYTIGFGVLQLAATQLTQWLLMGSRGIYW